MERYSELKARYDTAQFNISKSQPPKLFTTSQVKKIVQTAKEIVEKKEQCPDEFIRALFNEHLQRVDVLRDETIDVTTRYSLSENKSNTNNNNGSNNSPGCYLCDGAEGSNVNICTTIFLTEEIAC